MVLDTIYSDSNSMFIVCAILYLFLMPVAWSYRDSLGSPIDKRLNKYWHWLGFIIRGITAVLLCPVEYLALYAFYFWIIFDGMYNVYTHKPWSYTGITAKTDILTGKYNHWIKWIGLLTAIVITLFIL